MDMISRLADSFLFWAAWIIIPFIMEMIPAIGSFVILFRKGKFKKKEKKELDFYPEITLLIPVYNSADTLEACIRSVNDSDYPNDRMHLFLINNQGQDNSFEVFCECQRKYPDLIMQWMNAKQGKSKALNLALFNSKGKYIINIDSDGLLEPSALKNLVYKFENNPTVQCMTGAILIDPEQIEAYPWFFPKLLRKTEFMEYAQAFLAGRNYASETNSIYTLSGAFSAFRKSAVLSSFMYNTDTICEDTEMTFQMRYNKEERVEICEDAIFFVDPIEDMNKLYTQRQRWQRGSLEVSAMFLKDKLKIRKMFIDPTVRTLVYDHTFAFPRMIWYLILICLLFMNYSMKMIVISVVILFLLYFVVGFFYYFSTLGFLRNFPKIQKYYRKQWYVVFCLPFFNLLVFFIRFAGIINSINTNSAWKTKNFTEEKAEFRRVVQQEFSAFFGILNKIRGAVNTEPVE
jgi:putative glycosyltransferase (exosortase G-associated)